MLVETKKRKERTHESVHTSKMPRIYASSLQGDSQRVLSEAAIQRQALHRNVHMLQTHPYTHSPSYSQYASSRTTSREVAVNPAPAIQHDKKNSDGVPVHNHPSKSKRRSSPVNPDTDATDALFHVPRSMFSFLCSYYFN